MERWEYHMDEFSFEGLHSLQQLGADGWELITVIYREGGYVAREKQTDIYACWFKRRLQEPARG